MKFNFNLSKIVSVKLEKALEKIAKKQAVLEQEKRLIQSASAMANDGKIEDALKIIERAGLSK